MKMSMNLRNSQKALSILLVCVAVMSLVGVVLLFLYSETPQILFFELLVFSISVIAVLMAVLGMIISVNQARVINKIANSMREAINGLKDLDAESTLIRKRLNQDYALAKDIAEALSDAGIMTDDIDKRKNLAGRIGKEIRRKSALTK